jgi:hypothetical protein
MGSHGGATATGQLAVLADLGMTPDALGMPVRATMETVELGTLPRGPTVHLERHAFEADAILAVNRIKAHTDFAADVESGLAKILSIGLGKRAGAESIHRHGPAGLAYWIPRVAAHIVATGKVLGGLAIVENSRERAARIEFVPPDGIGGPAEAALLEKSKQLMGRLPFDELDVAVVQTMGKDKSGSGLELSSPSHGNALGLGLADFVPLDLVAGADLGATYVNAITSGLGGIQRARIPLALGTERDAICAAILSCGQADARRTRLVQMRSTLELDELLVSEPLLADVTAHPDLEVVSGPAEMTFAGGRLRSRL